MAVNPGKKALTVQGVIKDVPRNSHLRFDIVIPLSAVINKSYCFSCNNTNTYFLLREGSDPVKVAGEITLLAKENFTARNITIDFPIEYHLQPIKDIHLHSNYRFEFEANGNSKYLTILSAIAFLILLSAGMNYFNLFFSIASRRIHGIGIRIINGASRSDILTEFTTEALLTGLISIALAFILLVLLFPVFKLFLNLDFTLTPTFLIKAWAFPICAMIFVSLLAGWYLGYKLFRIAPVSFINKDINISNRKNYRRLLFPGQLVISIILIGFTIGALKQINHMQKEAFTMNIDQTVVVKRPVAREFNPAQKSFQESLLKNPAINADNIFNNLPGGEERMGKRRHFAQRQRKAGISVLPGRCSTRLL